MIYLDNAATTKPYADCLERANQYLSERFYNPSALYAEGYNLHRELVQTRKNILSHIANVNDFEIIFTSCGTEADNHALFCGGRRGNVVTTSGEHSAIFSCAARLKELGVEVRFASLNPDGSVNPESLLSLVDGNTSLVSVIHVNNETGAINDINALSKAVKSKNARTLFHSDGVQAFGKLEYRLAPSVDMYSVSAHKIGALKGTGALIKRKSLVIAPYIYGGGQENGLRSGTENVFGIKMLEFASQKKYENISRNWSAVKELNVTLRRSLDPTLFKIISSEDASPYILTVGAYGVRGETILHEVDDKGLIIGTGSACSSNSKLRHSRVMEACAVGDELIDGILRLSFCPENTVDEIKTAAEILNATVRHRRDIMA